MPEWRRIVLAFTVVMMLVPVVAVAAPQVLPAYLTPWMNETGKRISALEQTVAELQSALAAPPITAQSGSPVIEAADAGATQAFGTKPPTPSSTVSSSTTMLATTTSQATTTTTIQAPAQTPTGGTLTGSVCGQVTSAATLVGDVSLCGDLTVTGSGTTLYARSGVTVDANGHQIMFRNGARADWQGTPVFTWDANNMNLVRDININHVSRIIFIDAGPSIIRYVRVDDAGVFNQLGFYPLHWHLNGDASRGTLVEGVVVSNGQNHAFVPHGSNGITFKDTIALNTQHYAYWWDPQDSNGLGSQNHSNNITYDHALADGVSYDRSQGQLNLYHRIAGFWLGSGSNNAVRNSEARNVVGGVDCSGFVWPEKDHSVWTFKNNTSFNGDCHGIFVWQNDSLPHVVDGFKGSEVSHGAYVNQFRYKNLNVEGLILHALGRDGVSPVFDGGSLGDIEIVRHNLEGAPVLFRNLSVKSITVNNGADGGSKPGTFIFENTNAACDLIRYEAVVPGTKIVINGEQC
jgi:hypothetical protein